MWLKTAAKFLGGLLLAVLLLWVVLRGQDPSQIWETVRQAWLPGLVLCSVLAVGHNVFRIWRWRALLDPVRQNVPFRPMFDAVILGYMTSWLVPGRLGELVRPALLSGREKLPLGATMGTVLVDRLFDGMAVVVLFAAGTAITPLSGEAAQHADKIRFASLILVGVIGVPLIVLFAASGARSRIESWLEGRGGFRAGIGRFVLSVSRGTEALRQPRLLIRIVVHTFLAWGVIVLSTWVGIRACGVDVSPGAVCVILPLLVLGIALPTPGGAGGYHAAMTFGLTQLFAVPETVALGAAFAVHIAIVVPVILLGALVLMVDRIPFQDLLQAARQVRDLGNAES